ncbi:MAG TPA: S-methyl-5-thioribose-1-phosphate isomerase [Candidatus Thermoplasmatota archaeon]|nr:S-methyl-5-thioribose-1-phosphate isomerase [Candidatus Thermoplasmatota archaeon]
MSYATYAEDIRTMRVHGAGRIARHAARGLAAWEASFRGGDEASFARGFKEALRALGETRPTAVSLHNGLAFIELRVAAVQGLDAKRAALRQAAAEFEERSKAAVAELGRVGARALPSEGTFLTICNSHAAIGVFQEMRRQGGNPRVFALETRPWRQGHKTARELAESGVDVTLIVDNAAMSFIRRVDAVVTGCDTIAANGDVVNKVGTSGLALMAKEFRKPFYVAGETYKVDLTSPTGEARAIEEREHKEIADPAEFPGVRFANPVFDVTPASWLTGGLFTEAGLTKPQDVAALAKKLWS